MNDSNDSAHPGYSPFWAVWIVFLAMAAIQGVQVKALFQQKQQLKSSLEKSGKIVSQAQMVNATMLNVSRELSQMADSSTEARQILNDFQIQIKNSSNGEVSTAKPAEAAAESSNPPPPASRSGESLGNKKK